MNENIIQNFRNLILFYQNNINDDPKTKKTIGFKIRNFRKVISIIESYDKNIEAGTDLVNVKGIGEGTINRINQIIQNGVLDELKDTVLDKTDTTLEDLQRITGIGPANAKKLLKNNITLELILKTYEDDPKDEFFENFTHHQMVGIKYFHDIESRIPFKEISQIENYLKKHLSKIDTDLDSKICGSYRRKKNTSGDIDILLTHKDIIKSGDLEDQDYLCQLITILKKDKFIIDDLTYNGNTKYMGMCRFQDNPGRRIDIRLVPLESYGSALLYFTGSGDFNKNMRTYALTKDYTINEYGIFKLKKDSKTKKKVKGLKIKTMTEEDIFKVLNLEYVEPENRLPIYKF
jgi:DNA polymerase beta